MRVAAAPRNSETATARGLPSAFKTLPRSREVETATAAIEIRLGFDPAPGGAVELLPRGAERSVETTIIEAKRGEAAESWELVLAVGDAEEGALAALRHVVYN